MNQIDLPGLYRDRRRKLAEQMGKGIALIGASSPGLDPALFDKNLRYLTGCTSRKALLLLSPGGLRVQRWETIRGHEQGRGRIVHDVLFTEERTPKEKAMDGEPRGA